MKRKIFKRVPARLIVLFLSLLFSTGNLFAQSGTVSGKVTDENGMPLTDVSVLNKTDNKGTTTTSNGIFSIQAKKGI